MAVTSSVLVNILSQIAQLEHSLSVGGSSTPPTQRTFNLNPFAPPKQHDSVPLSVGTVDMAVTIATLDVKVMALQAEVTQLKRGSNDTVLKVGFEDLPSVDSFAAW